MRRAFGLGLALATLTLPGVCVADDIKSGPDKKIGGAFDVKVVTGENKGRTMCYV
ncbi:MAG: hypothetical protein NZ703_02650 [Gemmataceae bacterium]|nr:hypothetical protein [Gemmataceae bacterium]MCS7269960.1 hypothetical protein [Gemmataceae bacterium]MDW8244235.1 hypothetical protein [Thermogemmata sp.]